MIRFDAIRSERERPPAVGAVGAPGAAAAPVALSPTSARIGKKGCERLGQPGDEPGVAHAGARSGVSLQALMGEAFDDLLRKYGKHPFGER